MSGGVIPQVRYEALEAGYYPAMVQDVELTSGEFGEQVRIKFEISDGAALGRVLSAWAAAKFSSKSKLFQWVNGLLFDGKGVPASYDLALDDLQGRSCLLQVSVKAGSDGEYNRVEAVLPSVNGSPVARPALVEDDIPF